MEIQFKSFGQEIKDIDEKGKVEIYVNAFDNTDSDGDISVKGSFKKTINENFNRIKHFLNHDGRLLIGVPLEMKEDSFGLRVVSQLNLNKEIGRDTYEDYKLYKEHGRTLEHSIGFKVMQRNPVNQSQITEYKLWEYSTLTSWGANENTPLLALKSNDEIIDKIKELTEMYNASYSDGRLSKIEQELKSLQNIEPLSNTQIFVEPISVYVENLKIKNGLRKWKLKN